jgi:transketolase
MRAEFASSLINLSRERSDIVFLSGDLGYLALEDVRNELGERFINAGVAEQNMISVAAGLAAMKFMPWVYSIASFVTLRPYEQIRNDICLHKLPVKIVGNGGGYGYGIMGATHHVLQDIGLMRMLPHMQVYVPLFADDVAEAVSAMAASLRPGYLRLNLGLSKTHRTEPFAPWRQITKGDTAVVVSTGPVIGELLDLAKKEYPGAFDVWSVGVFPFEQIPEALLAKLNQTRALLVIEEHGDAGGLGEALAGRLLGALPVPIRYKSLHAKGYPSSRYGSQKWHQAENALAGEALQTAVLEFIYDLIHS